MKKLKILSGLVATQGLTLPWLNETSVSSVKCLCLTHKYYVMFVGRLSAFPNTAKLPVFKMSIV